VLANDTFYGIDNPYNTSNYTNFSFEIVTQDKDSQNLPASTDVSYSINSQGEITVTPINGFTGPVTFLYKVTYDDGNGNTAFDIETITVEIIDPNAGGGGSGEATIDLN